MSSELDAFIAEKVMGRVFCDGWEDSWPIHPLLGTQAASHSGCEAGVGDYGSHISRKHEWMVPRYSTDQAACALLKARLRNLGIGFSINHGFPVGKVGVMQAGGNAFEAADTEEMAVALFAKALVETAAIPEAP